MNTGEVIADNPGFEDIVFALAAAPDEPEALAARPVAPRVLAAVEARRAARLRLRLRALFSSAAAAAAAVAVFFARSSVPAAATGPSSAALAVSGISSAQRSDGSWASPRGGEALAPAATAIAVMRLSSIPGGASEAAPALEKAAKFLRSVQNPDGSFGAETGGGTALGDRNLALCASALLALYRTGSWPELFTPVDGAVSAVRKRLAALSASPPREGEVQLAAALAAADALEWPDEASGALRNSLRRFAASDDPAFAPFAASDSFSGGRKALEEAFDASLSGYLPPLVLRSMPCLAAISPASGI